MGARQKQRIKVHSSEVRDKSGKSPASSSTLNVLFAYKLFQKMMSPLTRYLVFLGALLQPWLPSSLRLLFKNKNNNNSSSS